MIQSISPAELNEKITEPATSEQPLLLDVREPEEFEFCHIRQSINVPLNEISRRTDELDDSRQIVVICHHGMRSLQAARFLEQNGFSNVINLAGGVDAWAIDVDSSMPRY